MNPLGGSKQARPSPRSEGPAALSPSSQWLHPSMAALVAEEPRSFARAAVEALTDAALWHELSRRALRQMRLLVSPARQSAVLSAALRDPLLLDAPAEQACLLVVDACSPRDSLLPLLRTTLAALLSLRITVHILLLPAAAQPQSEIDLLGWLRTQGVLTYAGDAAEQWTAILLASAAPPLRFALLLHDGLPSLSRSFSEPHCLSDEVGQRCLWTLPTQAERGVPEVVVDGGWAPGVEPPTPLARALGTLHATLSALVEGEARIGAVPGNHSPRRAAHVLSEAHGSCTTGGAPAAAHAVPLIRLLDCVDRAQRLPIVVLVARSASLHLAELLSRHVVAGADGLQRAALDYERAIWARASLVVGRTPQQVETMRAVAPEAVLALMPRREAPRHEGERAWSDMLSKVLYPDAAEDREEG